MKKTCLALTAIVVIGVIFWAMGYHVQKNNEKRLDKLEGKIEYRFATPEEVAMIR